MDPVPTPPPTPVNPLDQQRLVEQAQKRPKDIYSSSSGEIFTKNFLAGFARALGSIVIYLVFMTAVIIIISRTLLPQLLPLISSLQNSLNLLQNPSSLQQTISPNQVEQL